MVIPIIALLLQATAPASAPVYLKCTLAGDNGPIDVQLNEANGTATYSFTMYGEQHSYNVAAAFTADRVTFNSFTISRVDLSFQRDNSEFAGLPGMNAVDHGQCQQVTVNRQF